MAEIINGKEIAENILNNIKKEVENFDVKPTLAVIIVGNDPASKVYVKNKIKKSEFLGFNSILKELPEDIQKEELLDVIKNLNNDKNVNGILLQLPLPKGLDEKDFLDEISPIKDVDGFTTYNSGKLFKGEKPYSIACTPKGIIKLLETKNINLEGKVAVVVGRSNIVGKPVANLLLQKNATVIQAHSKTKNLPEILKLADIIISATGKEEFIKGDMVKEGAIIIDVGITRNKNGKLTGDVDFESVYNKVSYITPVPGGVGPMTIATLMENTLELYKLQKGIK
ncbi:TPA: bifunctional 5,10-methylenetetrahydrofolate dehydrogenase/5,10-methenyltetrahydrofolate cyclohydrolase [Candidatus Galligastranaerophilus intestinigallinarum]|nr:bifunctional 5,10-methylenetetrahydrofolate dehydrogenase/5,10-methenyltetrahydrofolate cyclohydrolase [Candidatus Galligastranaerophilus intestinigallinarum]